MSNLLEDLSVITRVCKYNFDELASKSVAIISHSVEESLRNKENITEVDIGIGTLLIKNEEETLLYKFIPSKKLEESVKTTVTSRKSPLAVMIDETLGRRITNTYKDLF